MKSFAMLSCVLTIVLNFNASLHAADGEAGKKKLVHVVCLKFADTVTPEQIKKIETDFRALKAKIPQIIEYAGGANFGTERAKGFAHCSVVAFKSKEDLDTYVKHPDHAAFAASLKDLVADVFVMDFWDVVP
jgi:hypothetical protein